MTPQRFFEVLRRRAVVVAAVLVIGIVALYSLRNAVPSTFAGVAHVLLVADNGARDPSVSIVDLPSVATSTVVLERVRNQLSLPDSLISVKRHVSASVLGRSTIMAISYRDQSAARAIAVSNAVADQLAQYYDELSTARYDINVAHLSNELVKQVAHLRSIERTMSAVAAQHAFVISDKAIDDLTEQLAVLNTQRGLAVAQLDGDEATANTTAPTRGVSKIVRHEILTGDATYQDIRLLAARDSAELAATRASYTDRFPGLPGQETKVAMEMMAASREATRALADRNAYSPSAASTQEQHSRQLAIIQGDRARISQLDRLIVQAQAHLLDLPVSGAKYADLRAQRDVEQSEYAALANRRANALANRAEAASLGNVVVLDRAIKADTELAGGRAPLAVVASMLIIGLAIGSAFLIEAVDPRILEAEDAGRLYGVPVLANLRTKA